MDSLSIEQRYDSAKQKEIYERHHQYLTQETLSRILKVLVFPAVGSLLSAVFIYAGINRKISFVAYGGVVGWVASGVFGYRRTQGIGEQVRKPTEKLSKPTED